ncbi:MAG: lipopolysaccharide heptosyltransferase II [Candidatus Rifleibacteriota bacterium]
MKILIIGLNWLGDVIMSLPAIFSACSEQNQVHILTRPNLAEVYEIFSDRFEKIHKVETKGPFISGLKQIRELRKNKFDHIVVLPDSPRAAIVAWLCGGSSIGYKTQGRSIFLGRSIEKPLNFESIHESRLHFDLVKAAGISNNISSLAKPEFSKDYFEKVCRKLSLDNTRQYYIIAPGAAFGAAKRWPEENFADLTKLISMHHHDQILVTGSPGEKGLADYICSKNPAAISIAGRTSLTELAVLLSKAKGLVANDSGTMHLAALFNTPTVVPVGPTDMTRTGSLSSNAKYVYGSPKCDLAPCRQKVCPDRGHICMKSISAIAVYDVLMSLEDRQA